MECTLPAILTPTLIHPHEPAPAADRMRLSVRLPGVGAGGLYYGQSGRSTVGLRCRLPEAFDGDVHWGERVLKDDIDAKVDTGNLACDQDICQNLFCIW